MSHVLKPWQLFLLILAGWIHRHQQEVIGYLETENRVLREKLGEKRILLNDDQRRRLAVKGKVLGRKALEEIATLVTSDTILRWPRELIAAAVLIGSTGFLALLAADPRLPLYRVLSGALPVFAGIAPFCGILGFLTPMMVNRISAGDPDRAGTAYAVNTAGCLIGPLLSGFLLLPLVGERWTTVLLLVPLFGFMAAGVNGRTRVSLAARSVAAIGIAVAVLLSAFTKDWETLNPRIITKRDRTATVIAAGAPHPQREAWAAILQRVATGTLDATVNSEVLQKILHVLSRRGRREAATTLGGACCGAVSGSAAGHARRGSRSMQDDRAGPKAPCA